MQVTGLMLLLPQPCTEWSSFGNYSICIHRYVQTNRQRRNYLERSVRGWSIRAFIPCLFATSNRSYFRPVPEMATAAGTTGLIQSNDLRYQAYFTSVPAAGATAPNLAITKYRGKNALTDGNANFVALRSGEMYLIRAEANARLGGANEATALADLNALRAARITGYTPEILTGAALVNAIADERRREMFGEGHRFFDLKRTTRIIQRGSVCGTSISSAGNCVLAATAREWALPIPESALGANKNLTQNPGY